MPIPGFRQVNHISHKGWGYSETFYLNNSNMLLLIRTEIFDINGATAYLGWGLVGPPTYSIDGNTIGGMYIYTVWDKYSGAAIQKDYIKNNPDKMFEGFYSTMQVPGMSEKDRLEDLGRVAGTATKVFGTMIESKDTSRLKTALLAGLSDEDALHYVNGNDDKISKGGLRKLKKQQEKGSGNVMLDPMRPGETMEEWLKRTGSDMGDGAPIQRVL